MASKRVQYFDMLNVAACISVVALHCNQMVHTWQPGGNWLFALAIEVLFYWAVPIFFMLTGATLMEYRSRYDTKTFLRKRFERTVIPFVAWSLILYLFVSVPLEGTYLGPRSFVNMLLNCQIEQVYWFFFPLFSIYLSMPLLSRLAKNEDTILYAVLVSFVLASVMPYLCQALGIQWSGSLSISAFSGMLLYVGLGYLLSKRDLSAGQRKVVYVLGIASMVFRYVYTAYFSGRMGAVDRLFFSYSAFPAVFQGIAVFVMFKSLDKVKLGEGAQHTLSTLSSCSFGVYLIHKPILDRVVMGLFGVPMQSVLLRTLGVLVLYLICVALVYVMKKLPAIRRIVP